MSLIYSSYAPLDSEDLTFDSASQSTVRIYYQKKDYILRVQFNATNDYDHDIIDNLGLHYSAITNITLTAKMPDGTVHDVPIDDRLVVRRPAYGDDAFAACYCIVRNNELLTSQLGVVKLLLKVYVNNSSRVGSGRSDLNIISADAAPYKTINRNLDFWPGAVPTVVHLSQDDENVLVRFYVQNTHIEMNTQKTGGYSGGSNFIQHILEGTRRKTGQKLSCRGTRSYDSFGWSYSFTIPKSFTEEPGEIDMQVHLIWTAYMPTRSCEIRSSKIIFVIEPMPHNNSGDDA